MISYFIFFFFFQAEDGIRDLTVTGVQTCALPICARKSTVAFVERRAVHAHRRAERQDETGDLGRNLQLLLDRKSTRLNSSHSQISYAVFCLKKKTKNVGRRRVRCTVTGAGRGPSHDSKPSLR